MKRSTTAILVILLIAAVVVLVFFGRSQDNIAARAQEFCSEPNVAAVAYSTTTKYIRVTSSLLGGGEAYYSPGGAEVFRCPVVGPQYVSQQCKDIASTTDWQSACGGNGMSVTSTRTYTNARYGFSIDYPSDVTATTTFSTYYHLQNTWRAEAAPGSVGTNVIAIPVFQVNHGGVATGQPYPLYFDAEVRVGVSSSTKAVANCLKPDPGYSDQTISNVLLGGVAFKKFDFGDAGMMQYVKGESYRAVHGGLCYAVEQTETGSDYRDPTMTPGLSDQQLTAYYNAAGDIAQTFRLTK